MSEFENFHFVAGLLIGMFGIWVFMTTNIHRPGFRPPVAMMLISLGSFIAIMG